MKANRTFSATLITAAIVALCAPAPCRGDERQSQTEMASIPQTPTTPFALLQNIKFALDHRLLLREDFYTEANLMQFFGGKKVDRTVGGPNAGPQDVTCELTGFGMMVDPVKVGSFVVDGMSLLLRRRFLNDGRISGALSLGLLRANPSLSFDEVTKLFGPNWRNSKDPKVPHLKPDPPRKAHGDAKIEYVTRDTEHRLSFNPDAILGSATFVLYGKK